MALISNVSDTARWTAHYRATETARRDAHFRDPLAAQLAGERGAAIAAAESGRIKIGWGVVARTVLMDRMITDSIAEGCDRVLSLAAGFDTRPYRMDLPGGVSWVEADLPELIAEKEAALADQTPRCAVTRHAVDLADPAALAEFLDTALAGADKPLVLTEGLTMYLKPAEVVALSTALRTRGVSWWVLDLIGPGIMGMIRKRQNSLMANAPFRFGPANGIAFFEDLGWRALEFESQFKAAYRLRRLPWFLRPFGSLPERVDPRNPGSRPWSAIVRLAS